MPNTDPAISRPGEYNTPTVTGLTDTVARDALKDMENAEMKPEPPKKSSLEKWRENIKEVGLSEDEANAILDSILDRGYWSKEYILFRGRLKIVLRTRDMYHSRRIVTAVDRLALPTEDKVSVIVNQYNLACSIEEFRGVKLPHVDVSSASVEEIEGAFQKRLEFIDKKAGPFWFALGPAIENFDKIIRAALSEGAAPGF